MRRVLAVVTAGLVATSLAACGGDDGGDEDAGATGSSTTAASATSTTLDTETEVEQAYLAFDAMLTRLRKAPNPDDPEIERRTTGQTRNGVINSQRTAETLGESATFGSKDAVKVVDVEITDATTAVVRSCSVEDITITNSAGERLGPTVTTYWTDYTLKLQNSEWLVSSSNGVRRIAGEQPCDE